MGVSKEEVDHQQGYQADQPPAERLGDIATKLAAVVRNLDPSRPVTAALAGAVMSNETAYPGALDVVGYNYTEDRYRLDHKTYPDRVLYGSENRHDEAAWQAVVANDFIFAQFLWTGIDYLGEAGPWPSRGFTTGLLDLAGTIKPIGHFRKALWTSEPMAYLGAYVSGRRPGRGAMQAKRSWDFAEGQRVRVVCYTNGDSARLFLNGQPVGECTSDAPESAILAWDVDYHPGKLEVVVEREGRPVARDALPPDGEPHALVATNRLPEGVHDTAVIAVAVVDDQRRRVESATPLVTCTVTGPGRLLGLENASPDASQVSRENRAACQDGQLTAYIQATAATGTVTATFAAPGLKPAQVELLIVSDHDGSPGSRADTSRV